jgi:CTP synthase
LKFIFVTGGVMSSVGKGIVTSSLGKELQDRGYTVYAVKMDPYVNVDAGTMNPYQHGEVYVTKDGGETDLDLGHYERFLDVELDRGANITTGLVYKRVIEKERKGEYLGQTVQIIPHIVDEIKLLLRTSAKKSAYDILLTEIGGTVGDIESLPFLEAIRQIRMEEGYENTVFVHVTLVPTLQVTGEMKTKPAQHSIQELRRIGIQPDIIVARGEKPLDGSAVYKLSLYSSVPREAIFSSYNVGTIYQVPTILDEQGMGAYLQRRLMLESRQAISEKLAAWKVFVDRIMNYEKEVKIAMVGKYTGLHDAYLSIIEALTHAGASERVHPSLYWVNSEEIEAYEKAQRMLEGADGIMVLPGFGRRGTEGKITAIEVARTRGIPFLGICFGMQLAVVEYARDVLGLTDANSSENDPNTEHPVIDLLPEQAAVQEKGGTMRLGEYPVELVEGSVLYSLYRRKVISERHRHRYEVNPKYIDSLVRAGLRITGYSTEGHRVEAIELVEHPYFVATQFHPEFKSRPLRPSPPYVGLIRSSSEKNATVVDAKVGVTK